MSSTAEAYPMDASHRRDGDGPGGRATLGDWSPHSGLSIRPLDQADREWIEAFYAGLSPRTLCRRFHTPAPTLRPYQRQFLLSMDGRDHVALGAFRAGELVGEGRYVRLPRDATTAEPAIVVAEHARRQGVGRSLLHALARSAGHQGIDQLIYTVQADNEPAMALFGARGRTSPGEYAQYTGAIDVDTLLASHGKTGPALHRVSSGPGLSGSRKD